MVQCSRTTRGSTTKLSRATRSGLSRVNIIFLCEILYYTEINKVNQYILGQERNCPDNINYLAEASAWTAMNMNMMVQTPSGPDIHP